MGGEEVLSSYLRSKLSSILDEAEADSGSPSHIIPRLRSIQTRIESMFANSWPMMMIIPVDLLYELIELLSECRVFSFERRTAALSKKGFGFYFPKLLRHPPLSKLMFNRRMRRRLDYIERKIGDCSASQEPPPPPAPIIEETRPIEDPSLIIGFEAQAEKIEAWLMPNQEEEEGDDDDALRAVGIVGRFGCGKTALAQKVFASPRIVKEFSPRIWVSLSNMLSSDERVDPRVRVANYILREFGQDIDNDVTLDSDYMSLAEKLQRGLMGKRYLIVLDGAWRLDDWYDGFFPKGSGGAVIVTSSRENVIRRMVGDDENVNVIRLQPHLSDEICWQIFSQVVQQQGKLEITNPKLDSIQDDVKRSIDGLPLVAKTLANILPDFLLFKSYWIPARDLSITYGDDTRCWRWISLPPPQEMEEVAELLDVCLLDIKGSVDLKKLLIKARYSAYLVFKLKEERAWLHLPLSAEIRIIRLGKNPKTLEECHVFIDPERTPRQRRGQFPQAREGAKGWMEIKLGNFFTTLGDDGRSSVEVSLFEVQDPSWKDPSWKFGLVVRGIELR